MIITKYYKYLFPGIFILSFIIFLAHTAYTKTAIFADGRFYYATTRSIVKDFNIKFANEFEILGVDPTYTNNDYVWNKYPPGAPLLWTPLFFVADGLVSMLQITGLTVDSSGYGVIYEASVALTSAFLGTLGLYLVYQLLKVRFSQKISIFTTLALFSSTNLLFYLAVEPIGSHAASFFISALFVYYFLRHQKDRHYYFTLGVIGGVAGLVRTQDALILLLPILQSLGNKKRDIENLATNYILLATGFLIAFFPQIIFWKKIFNTYWYSPYLEEGFSLLKPQIMHVLFNIQNGLYVTTPVIGISFLGLFLFLRKGKKLGYYALFYFLIQLYLISSWGGFFQGGSFSIRMMVSTYPLLSFGLASVIEQSGKKLGNLITYTIIGFLSALNSLLIIRYLLLY